MVALLIDHGADVDKATKSGHTPLLSAVGVSIGNLAALIRRVSFHYSAV